MKGQFEVLFAGFGGQGILLAGQLLAYAGIHEGKNVVWLPSYGPEMRGGTAYCMVVISDARIGSPIINDPRSLCAFNRPSLEKFAPKVRAGGLVLINTSLIDIRSNRADITEVLVPANEIALKAGSAKIVNMVMLGAFVGATGIIGYDSLQKALSEKLGHKRELLELNKLVIDEGYQLGANAVKAGSRA